MSDYSRYSKCADIPGWLVAVELFDFGTKLGVAIWNGDNGAGKKRHAIRSDSLSQAIPILKQWADEQ